MKKVFTIIGMCLVLLAGCVYPANLKVLVDMKGKQQLNYEKDHQNCLERARIAWPCAESEFRAPVAWVVSMARLHLRHQKVMVVNCLERKGYSIVNVKEEEQTPIPIKNLPLRPTKTLYN